MIHFEVYHSSDFPIFRATTPDLSQIAIGRIPWLDGIGKSEIEEQTSVLMAAIATHDGPVHVVKMNNSKEEMQRPAKCLVNFKSAKVS